MAIRCDNYHTIKLMSTQYCGLRNGMLYLLLIFYYFDGWIELQMVLNLEYITITIQYESYEYSTEKL